MPVRGLEPVPSVFEDGFGWHRPREKVGLSVPLSGNEKNCASFSLASSAMQAQRAMLAKRPKNRKGQPKPSLEEEVPKSLDLPTNRTCQSNCIGLAQNLYNSRLGSGPRYTSRTVMHMIQRLSREELYNSVWREPASTLAPRFGISEPKLKTHRERNAEARLVSFGFGLLFQLQDTRS
jgi:hypothetical protein